MWKDIKNYEGLYQVNELGEVKALPSVYIKKDGKKDYRKEHIMSKHILPSGYVQVGLRKQNEGVKQFFVHRLVAEAFINNPNNYPQVNHKDENKSNNAVSNLEWCSSEYNLNYGNRKIKYAKSVDCLDDDGNVIKTYKFLKDATADGHKVPSIIRSCKTNCKHHGYKWRYSTL